MKDNVLFKINDFDLANSPSYHLYLKNTQDSYQYAVIDPANHQVLLVGTHQEPLVNTYNDILEAKYGVVKISLFTKSYTFIPEVHYSNTLEPTFTTFLQADNLEIIQTEFLKYQEIRNIYALNKIIFEKLQEKFPIASFYSQVNPFFKNSLKINSSQTTQLFINFLNSHIELLFLNNQDLLFYNIFEIKNNDELQYFILLALQQLNLSSKNVHVNISGTIDIDSTAWQKLSNLFAKVDLAKPENLNIPANLEQAPLHYYFSLLGLNLCE